MRWRDYLDKMFPGGDSKVPEVIIVGKTYVLQENGDYLEDRDAGVSWISKAPEWKVGNERFIWVGGFIPPERK